MSREITLLRGSTGINNVVDPARLKFSSTTGLSELQSAVNVEIDETGRINRRKGSELLTSLPGAHSLFEYKNDCFVVADGNLYRVNADFSLLGLRAGMTDAPMSFAGYGEKVFYANGSDIGYINLFGPSYPWVKSEYEGPLDTRHYYDPPVGHLLMASRGRMFIAEGDTVWCSEPFTSSLFRTSKGFYSFDSRISMMASVDGGVFIGTQTGVFFISVEDAIRKVSGARPFIGSAKELPDGAFPWIDTPGSVVVWSSDDGIIVGTSSGQVINITENKLLIPKGHTYGATILRDDGFLVASMY